MARMGAAYRRYAGIIVDVFYDHCLAGDWALHANGTLEDFTKQAYQCFEVLEPLLPATSFAGLCRLRDEDFLCSYRSEAGVELALGRISRRLRRPFDLRPAVSFLQSQRERFQEDFRSFFPVMRAHVTPVRNA